MQHQNGCNTRNFMQINQPDQKTREKEYEAACLTFFTALRANPNLKQTEHEPSPAAFGLDKNRSRFIRFAVERAYNKIRS